MPYFMTCYVKAIIQSITCAQHETYLIAFDNVYILPKLSNVQQ